MQGIERWKGRVALVTGASSGIGQEVARRLAGAGLSVALAARRAEALQELAREIGEQGGAAIVIPTDLRDERSIEQLFTQIHYELGGVDVLINNAGLGFDAPLLSGDTARWREMLEVNVLALCICAREAVADMRRRGVDGHVVNISSMAAHRVPPGAGVYSATKYAVRSLTEGLRQEIHAAELPVRVSSISPGFVETGFAANFHGDEAKATETYSRYKCLETPDIADAVEFVLAAPPRMQVHDILIRPTQQPQ